MPRHTCCRASSPRCRGVIGRRWGCLGLEAIPQLSPNRPRPRTTGPVTTGSKPGPGLTGWGSGEGSPLATTLTAYALGLSLTSLLLLGALGFAALRPGGPARQGWRVLPNIIDRRFGCSGGSFDCGRARCYVLAWWRPLLMLISSQGCGGLQKLRSQSTTPDNIRAAPVAFTF